MSRIEGLDDLIRACEEAEALGWKSLDFFSRSEGDADAMERVLQNAPQFRYTRRRTNFEITWNDINTPPQNHYQEEYMQNNEYNPIEAMLRLMGY